MENGKIYLAEQLWNLHEKCNILEDTKLGYKLFWQLLKSSGLSPYSLTIKSLNCDVHAATSALRKSLRKLEKDGWICTCTHPDDCRVRCVQTTKKFHELADEYIRELENVFELFEESADGVTSDEKMPTPKITTQHYNGLDTSERLDLYDRIRRIL